MIETFGFSFLTILVLSLLLRKPLYKLWDERACQSYSVDYTKKLTVPTDLKEVKLLILGDTGSGTVNQKQVSQSSLSTCEEKGCHLVILTGDNFIQSGVACIEDEQWVSKFESMYDHNLPFFVILGNHDLKGNWRAQLDYSKISERWNMPSTNYDFEAGPVTFQAINTTCSIKSLWRLFRKSNKPWRVALGHHPAISSGRHGGMTWLERFLVSKSGINFFVSGHNHVLEHLEYGGFDQIVSGGGGSPIENSTKPRLPNNRFFKEDFGYIWGCMTENRASFSYFDIRGKEIYRFEKSKK
ncbi:metallophosphoesterase [bacterium]|nr:metallophosphoesterase [bacterium]